MRTSSHPSMNSTIRITEFNDLIAPGSGYFAFDGEGKLIKTGFVTGGGVLRVRGDGIGTLLMVR